VQRALEVIYDGVHKKRNTARLLESSKPFWKLGGWGLGFNAASLCGRMPGVYHALSCVSLSRASPLGWSCAAWDPRDRCGGAADEYTPRGNSTDLPLQE